MPLRPLGIGELFTGAGRAIVRAPRPILVSSLLTGLVIIGIRLAAGPIASDGHDSTGEVVTHWHLAGLLALFANRLLPVIIVAVTAQATLSLVAATLPKSGQIYRRTLRLLPLLLAVELIRLITLGVLGLFAVGVFLFVAWSLVPFVLIAEGGRFLDSFSRSIELIRESWWRVTGLLSLVFVMSVYPTYEITSLTTPLGDLAPGFWWLGVVLSELVLIPLSAFGAAFGTLIYVDLRCRKEGLAWRLDSARRGPEREPFGPHGVYAQLPWQPTARR